MNGCRRIQRLSNRNGLRPIVADAIFGLFDVGPSFGHYVRKWRRCGICSFTPASSDLHYRDPNYYKQMPYVIYELEKVHMSQMFNRCTVFSVQIDISCDRQMLDHKFVSGRMANSDGSLTNVFVVMHSPEKNGAPKLLEAVNKALDLTEGKAT